jgi:hypothetical protein
MQFPWGVQHDTFHHIRVVFIGNSRSHSTGNIPNTFSIVAEESPLLSVDPALVGTPSSSGPGNENEFEEYDDEDEGGKLPGTRKRIQSRI